MFFIIIKTGLIIEEVDMKVKSFLISLLFAIGGSLGAFALSLPTFSTHAVSIDASVWNGEYAETINEDDVDILFFDSAGKEFMDTDIIDIDNDKISVIRIYTAKGFSYFARLANNGTTYANKTIYLESDINLNNEDWTPIGQNLYPFMGTFDGNNHTIYNLKNDTQYDHFGLFYNVEGTVENLVLDSVNISYTGTSSNLSYVGAVAAILRGGMISNVNVKGQIDFKRNVTNHTGGLVGYAYDSAINDTSTDSPAEIVNCFNYASITGTSSVGGLVGFANGHVEISGSANLGKIANTGNASTYIGGLVGNQSSTSGKYLIVTNSFNNGDISLNSSSGNTNIYAGGILGNSQSVTVAGENSNYFKLNYVYNAGDFSVDSYMGSSNRNVYIGGLVGYADSPRNVFSGYDYLISHAFNIGDLVSLNGETNITTVGSTLYFREIMCTILSENIVSGVSQNDVYYDYDAPYSIFYTSTSSNSASNDLRYLISVPHLDGRATSYNFLSTEPNKLNGIYGVGFDFYDGESGYWLLDESMNEGLPYLFGMLNSEDVNNDWAATISGYWEGNGTLTSPYLIYTAEDLSLVADYYNGGENNKTSITYFSLQNNIDLRSKAWEPIGVNGYTFLNSVFDGNGHTISGINCSLQVDYKESVGLFGTIENSVVRNVIIDDFRFIGTETIGANVNRATLVGNAVNSYIINCRDDSGFTKDNISGERVYTIANASNSYLIFGQNNIGTSNILTDGMTNISPTTISYLLFGVETYLNTDGGLVYDEVLSTENRTITPHLGDGKFIIINDDAGESKITSVKLQSESATFYDRTYMTTLPIDTIEATSDTDLDNSFYIVKEGYKIDHYTTSGSSLDSYLSGLSNISNTNSSGSSDLNNLSGADAWSELISSGITANWQEADDVEFKVYYNSYERYWHTVDETNYAGVEGANGQVDLTYNHENDKYVSIYMAYNSFDSMAGLQAKLEEAASAVRRENFEIVGIYDSFSEGVYGGNNYWNSTQSNAGFFFNSNNEYFLKWQGTDNNAYVITLNFADTASAYADRYDWTEAIDQIIINFVSTGANGQLSTVKQQIFDASDIVDNKVLYNYSTDAMDEYFEYIEIQVKLKFGFTFDRTTYSDTFEGPSNTIGNDTSYIENYGSAYVNYPSSIPDWNINNIQEVATYSFGQAIGDFTIDFDIARSSNSFSLSVGDGVYFALAIPTEVSNIGYLQVFTGESEDGFVSLQEYNSDFHFNIGNDSFTFGLNMFDNYMLSTSTSFDMENVEEYIRFNNDANYNYLLVRTGLSNYQYYLYEFGEIMNEDVETLTQTLYLVDLVSGATTRQTAGNLTYNGFTFKVVDRIASVERASDAAVNEEGGYDYNVNFYTNQEFGLIFSTESAENNIIEYSGVENKNFEVIIPTEESENEPPQKIYYDFSKAKENSENFYSVAIFLGASSGADGLIKVAQSRVTAKIDIQFVDENGNVIEGTEEMPLPVIYLSLNESDSPEQDVNRWTRYTQGSQITISPSASKSMSLRIVNNEYYQWTHRVAGEAVTFNEFKNMSENGAYRDSADQSTLSNELYLNIISNGTMFDADGNPYNYEELNSGTNLNNYFAVYAPSDSSSEIGGVTGMVYDSARTAFDFVMVYNEAVVSSSDGQSQRNLEELPNYDFTLTFVLKGVDYRINVETKYQQTFSGELYDDDSYASEAWVENDDETVTGTSVDLTASNKFGVETYSNVVSSSSTRAGDSSGYSFTGFQVVTGNNENTISEYISFETSTEYPSMLAFLEEYGDYLEYDSTDDIYTIDLRAIYLSNTINYEASGSADLNNITDGRTIIENYNGNDGTIRYLTQGISESRGLNRGTYYYSNNETGAHDALDDGEFVFEMNEYYSNRYTFTGVALVDSANYLSASGNYDESLYLTKFDISTDGVTISNENLNTISVDGSLIKQFFKNNIGIFSNQTIYIVPIVAQKTLIVSLTSGASADEIVYDADGTDRTNEEVELFFYYNSAMNLEFDKEYLKTKQDELESYYLVSTQDSVILNDFFSRKQGYQANGWLIYNADRSESTPILINYYRLDENYFITAFADAEGEADYRIYIERRYMPNSYYINYSSGDQRVEGSLVYGTATGSTSSTVTTYDAETQIAENGFSLTGYTFTSWNTSVDGTGRTFNAGDLINENLCTGDGDDTSITLYAQWTANTYDIEIIFNSGTYNGEESLVIDNITYNTTLGMLSEIVPTRNGFTFDGFYVESPSGYKSNYYLVNANSVLNTSIFGFSDVQDGMALTLYATWRYIGEVEFVIDNPTKTYTYTGESISAPIDDYIFNSANLQFNTTDEFTIESAFDDVTVSYEFQGASFDGNNITIGETNVGTYYVYMYVTLTDNSEKYSVGDIASVSGEFIFTINEAEVGYTYSSDYSIYYENIKYLVSLVETSEEIERVNGYGSFVNMMSALKREGVLAQNTSVENTYEYLFMKYFNMVNTRTNTVENYNTFMEYRNWTYDEYMSHYDNTLYFTSDGVVGDEDRSDLTGERATRANILANAFLLSYDVNNITNSAVLYGDGVSSIYNATQFVLTSPTSVRVNDDIQIESIEVVSSTNMRSNTIYSDVRAYVTGENLNNYNLQYITIGENENSYNKYYITLPGVYMLLQVLRLENNSAVQSAYYSESATSVSVGFAGEEQISYIYAFDRQIYTQLAPDSTLYTSLNLTTSNLGNNEQDTVYNFYDLDNHFNMSIYNVLLITDEQVSNVTTDVNLLLSEDFLFTIYNVKETARITITPTLLTKVDGFREIVDLDEKYYENLFSVTSFSYSLDGINEITVENISGLENGKYYSEDNGVLLFEITNNNSGAPVIISREPLTSVTIQVTTRPDQYIRLVDIGKVTSYNFEGNGTRATGEYVFDLSDDSEEIEYVEGEITDVNYYAIFSDLVRVVTDYNLPTDNVQFATYLKLGESTSAEIYMPREDYLICDSLTYTSTDGTEVDYTAIFTGANGTYVGVTDNVFEQITLKAHWSIGEVGAISSDVVFKQSVGTLSSIAGYEVGTFGSIEYGQSELFTYYFEMIYCGENDDQNIVVAQSTDFYTLIYNLENGGTTANNGIYRIKITVTMKEEYRYILADPENYQLEDETIEFEVDLQNIQIVGIDYVGATDFEYDGQDHTNNFSLNVHYVMYDATIDGYDSENVQTTNFVYGQDGMFDITIKNGDNIVNSAINVGEYNVEFSIDENYYQMEEGVTNSFTFNITPKKIDLATENINLSKKFNMTDPALQHIISVNGETLQLDLTRTAGEDIGNYDLFLANITCSNLSSNYQIFYGDTVLFDGTLQNQSTRVGNFEITKSDTLRLSWQGTNILSVSYNTNGYKLQIVDGQVIVYADTAVETRDLVVFDVLKGENLGTNLSLIEDLLNYDNIILKLYNSSSLESVYDSGVYEIRVEVKDGAAIANYYSNIIFDEAYIFQITAQPIDVSSFTFQKTYDGSATLRLDLEGNVLDENYEGVYITATFATYHAGQNISVSLMASATEGYNVNNYTLSTVTTRGTILKRDAVLNISAKYAEGQSNYIYGDLNRTNLASNLDIQVLGSEGEDLTDIFYISSYTLNLDLTNASTNRLGYYYQGEYQVEIVSSTFADFNISEISGGEVVIAPYQLNLNLPENYITISTLDTVGIYTDTQTYAKTGDNFELSYIPTSLTQGETAPEGQYDLALNGADTFLNGSIVVSLSAENSFQVVATDETIFLKFTDESLLNLEYNGYTYNMSVNVEDGNFIIENEDASPVNLSFELYRKTSEGDELFEGTVTSVYIYLNGDVRSFRNAGNYKLYLSVTAEGATNFAFYDNYFINVSPKEIDVTKLNIEKTYDGTNRLENIEFDEIVADDDALITAIYASSQVGDDIEVTLYLTGTSASNYTFSSEDTTGSIIKANATIALANETYTYGSLRADSTFMFVVTSGEKTVSTTEYSVVSTISNGKYSASGYLTVGSYTLTLEITSNNYNITPAELPFMVERYALNFTFTTDGTYRTAYGSEESLSDTFARDYNTILGDTIEVTFERSSGSEVGYYQILSGEVVDDNYTIASVEDTSISGAYRITPSSERYYLFISTDDVINADALQDKITMQLEYNGLTYSSITFEVDTQSNSYKIVLKDSTSASIIEYVLSLYSYNAEENTYTKTSTFDATVSADLSFNTGTTVKNAGEYSVFVNNATSTNFDVAFGQSGTLSSYVVKITPKTLTYKVTGVSKEFDNKNAVITYADANEILNGIVAGETISATLTMYDGDSVARYAGENYTVQVVLSDSTNYVISGNLTGTITKAKVGLYVENTEVTYGQQPTFRYEINYGDLDLTYYDKSQISVDISIVDPTYSTSNNLKVNETGYELSAILTANDFEITYYYDDTVENSSEMLARLYVNPRTLTIGQKDDNLLQNVFTKLYDGTNSLTIRQENGELLFNLNNVISGDIVDVASATFTQTAPGENLAVAFTLTGDDMSNYVINNYNGGKISPIVLNIDYDYQAEDGDNISANVDEEKMLKQVNYPFSSNNYLTANAADSTKNAFPTMLTGKSGHTFNGWTLNLPAQEGSDEDNYLSDILSAYNITYSYENGIYRISVGNNSSTVSLLNALLSDENDRFNLFEDTSSARVTFTANWIGNSYYLLVTMQDENGDILEDYQQYATISVNGSAMNFATYQTSISHGSSVEIVVTRGNFIKVIGAYENGEEFTFDNVSTDGNVTTYTINSFTSETHLDFRFKYDDISIILDLSGIDMDVEFDESAFTQLTNNKYSYTVSCQDLLNDTLSSLPALTSAGYNVSGYALNGDNENIITSDNFATELILSHAVLDTNSYVLTYSPIFEELDIEVVLDYNYNNLKETIFVPFNDKFENATGWVETPHRTGYEFNYWTDEDGNIITGESILTDPNGMTLTANWTILKNNITLALDDNLRLVDASVEVKYADGVYTLAEDVNFGEEITFTLQAYEGYEVDKVSYERDGEVIELSFEETSAGTVVRFTMLEPPVVNITATSAVGRNDVVINGEHFTFTASVGDEDISVTNNTFKVETGVEFTLNITLEEGYEFAGVETDNSDLGITEYNNGTHIEIVVSNISRDSEISIITSARNNMITFDFSNDSALNMLIVNGQTSNGNVAYIRTGNALSGYISLNSGYLVDTITFSYGNGSSQDVLFEQIQNEADAYNGYYHFTVENITADAQVYVVIGYVEYQVNTAVLVYDETGTLVDDEDILSQFTVLVNGEQSINIAYDSIVTLTYRTALSDYSFAGWSLDGSTIISAENNVGITITTDTTAYAIFSKAQFSVNFLAFSNYVLNQEYGDPTLEVEKYDRIYIPFYVDGQEASSTTIYYGSSKTMTITIPAGYKFLGYGYILNAQFSQAEFVRGDFEYISREYSDTVILNTQTMLDLGFGQYGNNSVPFFLALTPNSVNFNINSHLDFDGMFEDDNSVGDISLVGYTNGVATNVNDYGYVEGTLNHYQNYNGEVSRQNFTIVTRTNSEVYLKIGTQKNGYNFANIASSDDSLVSIQYVGDVVEDGRTYVVYRLYNIVGSVDEIDLDIYFQPQKNIIDINFLNENGAIVNGGNIFLEVNDDMANKVWGNGSNFSSLQVVGFTDTYFSIVAYVRLGFMIDVDNVSISYDNTITVSDIRAYELDFIENNYNYVIYFNVSALAGDSIIYINLEPQTYRVVLNDMTLDEPVVAVIDNVKFYETLDLSAENAENITSSLGYTNGMLNIVQSKTDYGFAGYFTYAGGRGVQYITSTGQTLREFQETGYILNESTGRYELSDNAYVDTDGAMVINLYLYWSYLKTQITFSLTPSIRANITAKDLVEGENSANSWFNEEMPLYIEVAFNTNITITAPDIDGYKFYKFVIKQRDANNNYLADVVSYSNNLPWSTNERDRIVEMTIEVYYFAKVNVTLTGGEMEYEIQQNSDDMYAAALVEEGYVDTTKEFVLTALESDGYDFNYWYKVNSQERYFSRSITDKISTYSSYILGVQGKPVTLSFSEYDSTSGHISSMQVKNISNVTSTVMLGHLNNNVFVKDVLEYDVRVGDVVTFVVGVDYGFGVSWNIENIELDRLNGQYLYFTMHVTGDMAETVVSVIPEFIGESMAIYVNRSFNDANIIDDATDNNDASYAGYVSYEGVAMDVILRDLGENMTLNIVENARYHITNIEFINYDGITVNAMDNYDSEAGTLFFTREEIDANRLAGTIRLNLVFERLYFEAEDIEEQGSGANNNPYLIYTIEDLTYYMEKINSGAANEDGLLYERASYRVMADLVLTEKFWTPIGTLEHAFNGNFNFNGHTISDIYLAKYYNPTSYGGLFGVIGYNAKIYRNEESYWYIYIILVIIIILLILLIILLIYNKRKKEKREELNTK